MCGVNEQSMRIVDFVKGIVVNIPFFPIIRRGKGILVFEYFGEMSKTGKTYGGSDVQNGQIGRFQQVSRVIELDFQKILRRRGACFLFE